MRVIFLGLDGRRDVEIRVERPGSAVSDLSIALGAGDRAVAPPGIFVDGLYRPPESDLDEAGLHEGAVLAFTSSARVADPAQPDEGGLAVVVLTGREAGSLVPLPTDGEYRVGRGADCDIRLDDPTVSRLHCGLQVTTVGTVTVVNYSTTVGTRVGGSMVDEPEPVPLGTPILLGATLLAVERFSTADRIAGFDRSRTAASGTTSFNRPPRIIPEPFEVTLDAPAEPSDSGKLPFNVASVVAPALFGLVMVFAFHNPIYALFALLSPLMVMGNWWESRHRSARALRTSTRTYARELEAFADLVSGAQTTEIDHRRSAVPNLAEVALRVRLPSVRLWERRYFHEDFLSLSLGFRDAEWKPRIGGERHRALPAAAAEILARHRVLFDVPVTVDLADGGVVGIAGARDHALALARSLTCQAAALHGPADLRVTVLCADADARSWSWAKWLPHARDPSRASERRLVAAGSQDTAALLASLTADGRDPADRDRADFAGTTRDRRGQTGLYVIDGDDLLAGRAAPARRLLRGEFGAAGGIVIAPTVDRLPAVCDQIVEVGETGEATVVRPRQGGSVEEARVAGLGVDDAERIALGLALFDDPELHVAGAGLPAVVRLGSLLGVDRWTPDLVADRWAAADGLLGPLVAAVGEEEGAPFELDLDRHGPHGLIGGTTGSGKSELLKSIVASIAASYPPDQVTFGLFDFKGGSTFTELGRLPHTVGVASDLDVNQARRALRCLKAELRHREAVFDEAGVVDLRDLHQRRRRGDPLAVGAESLPRLVVIIDEFAAMANELSEDIGAIADLTARGRSLGVHLLLATQKPSSSVTSEIRTNTRLRISLKVEDAQDSVDVVGIPDAAAIDHRGRGYFRVGQSEVLPIQSALSTGAATQEQGPAVNLVPFGFEPFPSEVDGAVAQAQTSELDALVDAACDAFGGSGAVLPRRPWPDPLPDSIGLEELAAVPPGPFAPPADIYFALADDPERQTRYPVGWPFRNGNLLLYGVVGSGTTTALATISLAFASGGSPATRHLYVLYSAAADLAELERLPHCGAVLRATDRDRQIRLLRRLTDELERRQRAGSGSGDAFPAIVVAVDHLEGFRAAFEDGHDTVFWDQFVRLYSDGPEVRIYTVATVSRVGGVPPAISAATPNKVLFRLADQIDYGALGLGRANLPTFVPGRAVLPGTAQVVQVARALPAVSLTVDAIAATAGAGGPGPLVHLAERISLDEVPARSTVGAERWDLVIGTRDRDLLPAVLTLYEGEHAFVSGRARSGKSTALLTIGATFLQACPDGTVVAIAPRRSPLTSAAVVHRHASTEDEIAAACNAALMAAGPTLVLVDDAEAIPDEDDRLAAVVSGAPPQVHIAAAANSDAVRPLYGHWTQAVRRARAGLLLQPALERDGDLLSARLPYRVHVALPPGRGFLVCGNDVEIVQTAVPLD